MASIPIAGISTVVFNTTVCQTLGFDAFNGTHCYTEGTSVWTDSPSNGVFESFEELYNYLDKEKRARLMEILHVYHKNQQGGYVSFGSLYFYMLVVVFVLLFVEILWRVWSHDFASGSSRRRLWPWNCMSGGTVYMNELVVRTGLLIAMAGVNAILWPITIPLTVLAITGKMFRTIGTRRKDSVKDAYIDTDESGSEDYSSDTGD